MVSLLLGGFGFFVRVRPGLGGRRFVRVKATAFFGLLGNHLELFFSMNPSRVHEGYRKYHLIWFIVISTWNFALIDQFCFPHFRCQKRKVEITECIHKDSNNFW